MDLVLGTYAFNDQKANQLQESSAQTLSWVWASAKHGDIWTFFCLEILSPAKAKQELAGQYVAGIAFVFCKALALCTIADALAGPADSNSI
jgi:hypothetical protein